MNWADVACICNEFGRTLQRCRCHSNQEYIWNIYRGMASVICSRPWVWSLCSCALRSVNVTCDHLTLMVCRGIVRAKQWRYQLTSHRLATVAHLPCVWYVTIVLMTVNFEFCSFLSCFILWGISPPNGGTVASYGETVCGMQNFMPYTTSCFNDTHRHTDTFCVCKFLAHLWQTVNIAFRPSM